MRVTPQQAETVKRLVHRHFGDDAEIWLYGSRVDDDKRGGDYDFLVETSISDPDQIIEQKIALIVGLRSSPSFADEKVDIVVKRLRSSFSLPIYTVAKEEGVRL